MHNIIIYNDKTISNFYLVFCMLFAYLPCFGRKYPIKKFRLIQLYVCMFRMSKNLATKCNKLTDYRICAMHVWCRMYISQFVASWWYLIFAILERWRTHLQNATVLVQKLLCSEHALCMYCACAARCMRTIILGYIRLYKILYKVWTWQWSRCNLSEHKLQWHKQWNQAGIYRAWGTRRYLTYLLVRKMALKLTLTGKPWIISQLTLVHHNQLHRCIIQASLGFLSLHHNQLHRCIIQACLGFLSLHHNQLRQCFLFR